ncbi:nucleotidyltransferase domain-containing protein [Oscillatoria sp. CS-180]|uniref:nucleotidyltransferase family protein n=1 Tax=Oscillatoria sp. CS-180 TaxID=3021720 RepID=UPI00232CDDEE|nr:nucleotidyltransferase domain-containing protein [Oscillatoria sp. CS-180]MDB9525396.1 nucleotidyltransferase domain-containing protein [Oscillatoria sp. CS-180]
MTEKFDTFLLDAALMEKRQQLEQERLNTLQQVVSWLDQWGADYGISRAYLFGSLVRSNRFHSRSDIDLAVDTLEPDRFFGAIAALSEFTGRDVDLVELSKSPFADRIRQTGQLWTRRTSPS